MTERKTKTKAAGKIKPSEQSGGFVVSEEAAFDASLPLENEQHERFCLEVLNGKSQARAYLLAFPDSSYESARANSSRLIANDDVKARLAYLCKDQQKRLKMSADEVLQGLVMAARFDPAELFNSDDSLIPVKDLPPEIRLCIERIEYDEVSRTTKIHVVSKKAALELLGKYHKLFVEKLEIDVSERLAKRLEDARQRVNGKR